MTILPIALALVTSVIGIALFARAVARIVGVVKVGQPTLGRSDDPASRWKTLLVESFGHTRMLKWSKVGVAHWFVFVGFMFLFFTLVTAFGQLFVPRFALPIIGHFFLYEWVTEALAWIMLACILYLIANRLNITGKGANGAKGRFFGSRDWQAYYVEFTILGIGLCIIVLRALEYQLSGDRFHFPLSWFLLPAMPPHAVETAIVWVAALKIIVSMAWFCVIGLNTTMGVAWHRFTAWPNIWFKREPSGAPALGAIPPVNVGGKVPNLTDEEEMDEEVFGRLGVGKVEDFSWKGLLDFTSCTECGRCQSQCPAWNTEKPLSPKLLMMGLREHAYAKAPYLQAAESARGSLAPELLAEAERPLVGATVGADASEGDARMAAAAQAHGNPISIGADGSVAVVDPDVLWSCTSCGACVQQCPVDIEHVDHIMDMRRFQVMVEGEFPSELNGLYKGLESKGNPWNMNRKGRLDWAKDLPFEVPVVGEDVADLTEVEYLFWVGCAGAYEDRAKKTTQAVAELLNVAGVGFAVLGNGETCTGDPARRSGNEMVFQQLAAENKETLAEAKASKVVTTCAHCLNTLKNEYPQIGVELEVVHHTQLLNRLLRDGRLTPVAAPSGSVAGRTITYHDPCYLGRHNKVYDAPRELLGAIPGATYAEMPRAKETSFCCGAGGARMWMEEKTGTRINVNRTSEALTVLDQAPSAAVATGCPFCRVMLSDGLTAEQAGGRGANVEVLDVAQLLLEGIRRGQPESVGSELSGELAGATVVDDHTVSERTADPTVSERAQRDEETVAADHAEEVTEAKKKEAGLEREAEQAPADEVEAPGEAAQVKAEPEAAGLTGAESTESESESKRDAGAKAATAAGARAGVAAGAISLKDLASKTKGGAPVPSTPKADEARTEAAAEAAAKDEASAEAEAAPAKPAPKASGAISLKDLASKAESGALAATDDSEDAAPEPTAATKVGASADSDAGVTDSDLNKTVAGAAAVGGVVAGAISLKDLASKAKGGAAAQPPPPARTEEAAAPREEDRTDPEPTTASARTAPKAAGAISLKDLAARAKGGATAQPEPAQPEPEQPEPAQPEPAQTDDEPPTVKADEADASVESGTTARDDATEDQSVSAGMAPKAASAAGAISLSTLATLAKGASAPKTASTDTAPGAEAAAEISATKAPETEGTGTDADKPRAIQSQAPQSRAPQSQAPQTRATQAPASETDVAGEVGSATAAGTTERPATPEPTSAGSSPSGAAISLADLARIARERAQND